MAALIRFKKLFRSSSKFFFSFFVSDYPKLFADNRDCDDGMCKPSIKQLMIINRLDLPSDTFISITCAPFPELDA